MTDVEPAAVAIIDSETPGGCSWPISWIDCGGGCPALEGLTPEEQQQVIDMAVGMLWEWTNRTFGVCEVTIRPCRSDCNPDGYQPGSTFWGRGPGYDPTFPRAGAGGGGGGIPWFPVLISGQWFNITCGCLGQCACEPSGPTVLSLPGPAQDISEVMIDGEVLPTTAYRLERNRWLIRTDGETWPTCQDQNLPDDADGAFAITYLKGVPVPTGGQIAAGRLACELAKGFCDDDSCALPERVQTVTRQGITVAVAQTPEMWEQTGIWSIDAWVQSVNVPRSRPGVRSVDRPRLR